MHNIMTAILLCIAESHRRAFRKPTKSGSRVGIAIVLPSYDRATVDRALRGIV